MHLIDLIDGQIERSRKIIEITGIIITTLNGNDDAMFQCLNSNQFHIAYATNDLIIKMIIFFCLF